MYKSHGNQISSSPLFSMKCGK